MIVDGRIDARTDERAHGRTDIWTPISHTVIRRCKKMKVIGDSGKFLAQLCNLKHERKKKNKVALAVEPNIIFFVLFFKLYKSHNELCGLTTAIMVIKLI